MQKPLVRIEDWSVTVDYFDEYTAPELIKKRLHGKVFGHPRCAEGLEVTTSSIQHAEGWQVETRNTTYLLGTVDPEYVEHLESIGYKMDYDNPVKMVENINDI